MLKVSKLSDKVAMCLSSACVVHCAFLPVLLMVLPSSLAGFVEDESFHVMMLAIAIPVSSFALLIGYKQHQQKQFLIFGVMGMTFLVLAVTLIEGIWGEVGETIMTILGSGFIFYGHYLNMKQGSRSSCGSCKVSANQHSS